jgi:hypothetical protein
MKKHRGLYVWHLLSSSLFCLGTVVPVLSYAICHRGHSYDHQDGSRHLAFRIMEGCSWTVLACHVLPELVIDLNTIPKSARSYPHMRYGTTPVVANFLQSILFAASCFFQGSFYCHVWSSDVSEASMKSYQVILLIAGHVWLGSGLVTCMSGRWEGFQYDLDKPVTTILDQVANDTYTVTTVLLCLAGYIMFVSTTLGSLLHALVRAVWAIIGAYHFSMDLRKMLLYNSTHSTQADGVDSPLRPRSQTPPTDDDHDDNEMLQQKRRRRSPRRHSQNAPIKHKERTSSRLVRSISPRPSTDKKPLGIGTRS